MAIEWHETEIGEAKVEALRAIAKELEQLRALAEAYIRRRYPEVLGILESYDGQEQEPS